MRSLTLLLLAACATPPPAVVVQLDVAAYRVPCLAEARRLCLLAAEDGGAEEAFYDPIDGWDFTWGQAEQLRIDRQEVEDPPADGSSLAYSHLATTRVTPAEPGDTFVWTFDALDEVMSVSGQGGTLADGKVFTCADAEVCAALEGVLQNQGTLIWAFADPVTDPLILQSAE